MVEESETGVNEGNVVLLACLNHHIIVGRATRTGDVLNSRLEGSVDVISEGKEGVRADGYLLQLANPFSAFSLCAKKS